MKWKRKKICSKNTCISIAFFVVVVVKFMTSFKHIRCCMFYIRVCRFTFSPPRSFAVLPWLKTLQPMQRTPLDSMVIGPTPGVGPGVAPLLMPLVSPEEYPASLSQNGVVHGPSWSGPSARGAGCFGPRPLGNTKRHLAKGWPVLNYRDPDGCQGLGRIGWRLRKWNILYWRNFWGRRVCDWGWPSWFQWPPFPLIQWRWRRCRRPHGAWRWGLGRPSGENLRTWGCEARFRVRRRRQRGCDYLLRPRPGRPRQWGCHELY